jgi:Flp pilus assembly protein TadD
LFRSIAWYEKGNFAEALRDVSRSLELDSADASAWQQRGNVLFALDQAVPAKDSFQHALKLSAGEAVTWNNLGVVCEKLGETNSALAAFGAATKCNPPSKNAFVNLACLQLCTGLVSEAEQTVAALDRMSQSPNATTLALRSVVARFKPDAESAAALEARARALDNAAASWVFDRAGAK